MRTVIRLLPLAVAITFCISAHAEEEKPEDWSLCPIDNAVPVFSPEQASGPAITPEQRAQLPTDIEGDSLEGVSGQNYNYSGNVALTRGDQFLGADNLTFDEATNRYTATGNVRYQDRSMRMMAENASGDQENDIHQVNSVRYQLTERRGNGGAESISMNGTQGKLVGATYSTCPPSDRDWTLRAQQIDVDTEKGFGTAKNATLRIGKIPVLYFPWFRFPIDNQRHTGLLYPTIGSSGRNGLDWRQPIYLNLAPNYDMTLTPRYMSKRGLMFNGEFRYLNESGDGTLQIGYLPSDDLTKREKAEEEADFLANGYSLDNRRQSDRFRFSFGANQRFNSIWRTGINLNYMSDPRYFEDFSNNLNGVTAYSAVSDVGIYGNSRYWNAGIMADYNLLADYTLRNLNMPYNRMPRLYLNWEQPVLPWLNAGVNTELVRFQHTDPDGERDDPNSTYFDIGSRRPGGSRFDVKPFISMPLGGASWYITPTLAWRYTTYQLDKELAQLIANTRNRFNSSIDPSKLYTSPSRSTPIASVDAGLYFDRNMTFRETSYIQTFEPRLFYLRVPYEDQSMMPLFDTNDLTFSWGQLFRDNRFSGADRQADANQITLAATSRFIRESDGREVFTANLGRIHYLSDSRVGRYNTGTAIETGRSSWVADANLEINDRWTIGGSYQWNPQNGRELAAIRTRYLVGDSGIINLAYRYRRDLLEQADLSFLYPINPTWSVVGRYYYSMHDKQLLEAIAGIQWESCCVAARLVGRRYLRNRTGETNDAIQLEIELKGLGSAGPDNEGRLRRAILGYYRDDLFLLPPPEVRGKTDDPSLPSSP